MLPYGFQHRFWQEAQLICIPTGTFRRRHNRWLYNTIHWFLVRFNSWRRHRQWILVRIVHNLFRWSWNRRDSLFYCKQKKISLTSTKTSQKRRKTRTVWMHGIRFAGFGAATKKPVRNEKWKRWTGTYSHCGRLSFGPLLHSVWMQAEIEYIMII